MGYMKIRLNKTECVVLYHEGEGDREEGQPARIIKKEGKKTELK